MGKTSIALVGLLFLAIGGMAQPIPAPATTSQATNLVAQDSYMSPARVGDFWYDVGIPFVLSNGGGTIASNSIAKNNGVGTNLTIYGTLTSTNFDSKIISASNGVLGTASNVFSIKGSAGGVVPAPATTSQATNLVVQDSYMSPARVGDFWNDVVIPYILTFVSGGSVTFVPGTVTNSGVIYVAGILTNQATFIGTSVPVINTGGSTNTIANKNGFGTNLTVYGTLTSTNMNAKISAVTNSSLSVTVLSNRPSPTAIEIQSAGGLTNNETGLTLSGTFTNGTFYGNGVGLTNVTGTGGATNAIANLNGFGTNTTLISQSLSLYSTNIIVTGTLSPNATGTYNQITNYGSYPAFERTDGAYYIYYYTPASYYFLTPTLGGGTLYWAGLQVPDGSYAPFGSATGTATATYSTVTNSFASTNINFSPTNGGTFIGSYYGNGSGLTNLPASAITNLGTAALQSTNFFDLAGIAQAATNNFGGTVAVNMTNAANKFTGIFTNGTYYGNGSGLTNIPPTALSVGATFNNVDIPTNTLGTHGYSGYFTNGVFVSTGTY